jgi:hypothetical protein
MPALETRARHLARKLGLRAVRSRWRPGSIDNLGGFMLVDATVNCVVAGSRFELTADEVIHYCVEASRLAAR